MKIPQTLCLYMGRQFIVNTLFLVAILLGIVFFFDAIELMRRASKFDDVPFSLVIRMGLLKMPEVGQMVLPFAILFSAMFTFWQMNRRYELIVMRAAGYSVWQFLAPLLGIAFAIGVFQVGVVNPVGAIFLGKFEELETVYLKRERNMIALMEEGLWLRQPDAGGEGDVILRAGKVRLPEWVLQDVTVLFFGKDENFEKRFDAPSAKLDEGHWTFRDVVINRPGAKQQQASLLRLATPLTEKDIEESFSAPETIGFWQIPGFIRTVENAGFDASRLYVHFQSLLALPLLFVSMIILAASVSLRPPRSARTGVMVMTGVLGGFFIFFMTNFLKALGISGQMPVLLAAWSPAMITFLLGLTVLLNQEDG